MSPAWKCVLSSLPHAFLLCPPLATMLPQTKTGRPARGPTAQEFREVITEARQAMIAKDMDPAHITWSWDNAAIHGSVEEGEWEDGPVRVTPDNHTMLPPYSPDMHCMIEQSHALVCGELQKFVNDLKPTMEAMPPLKTYIDKLYQIFYSKCDQEWGRDTLRRVFCAVIPAIIDAKGGWPDKKFR